MELLSVLAGQDGGTAAKIKNDFYYAFWYDMFLMKRSEMINLPGRLYQCF